MKPRILIVGAGDIGAHLARRLCESWDVAVLDLDPEALESPLLAGCATRLVGDGTSAMVLRQAGAEGADTLVAASDADEVNLEVLLLARERFGIDNLYAVMQGQEFEQRYRELPDVEVVDSNQACSALLESRLERRKVATNIGLGEGEIIEVEVLANSSVIGHRLADLHPRRWLVGAVYREGRLIVPHGDTVLLEGDRVVLIGEPEVLGAIANHIGAGESRFPLHYGSNIVAMDSKGLAPHLEELRYLLSNTAALTLELITAGGRAPTPALVSALDELKIPHQITKDPSDSPGAMARRAAQRDAGILALEPRGLDFWSRVGIRRTSTVQLIDKVRSPVLICRRSHPYVRVLLCLHQAPFVLEAAQLAIDLTRTLECQLTLGVVHQPDLVVGAEARAELNAARREVEDLCRLYHLELEVLELEGNPIQQTLAACKDFDLLVLPYRRNQRASLTRPDVSQNLLHRAPCSVLIMPHGGAITAAGAGAGKG